MIDLSHFYEIAEFGTHVTNGTNVDCWSSAECRYYKNYFTEEKLDDPEKPLCDYGLRDGVIVQVIADRHVKQVAETAEKDRAERRSANVPKTQQTR